MVRWVSVASTVWLCKGETKGGGGVACRRECEAKREEGSSGSCIVRVVVAKREGRFETWTVVGVVEGGRGSRVVGVLLPRSWSWLWRGGQCGRCDRQTGKMKWRVNRQDEVAREQAR
jgi:hypothetical protein